MSNINLCKKIVDDFFKNEEVKKHINIDKYRNVSIKENIRYFTPMNNNSNNKDYIVNCIINPNFIISEYTQNFSKDNNKNVYLNAVYHNDKKHLNFNTTINKNDYKLKT
jgi:hypothetical protein